MDNKALLRKAFRAVFESPAVDENIISTYFDVNYRQWVDGNELDFNGFVKHLYVQKRRVDKVSFYFKSMVAEGNVVATIHHINATTKQGNLVQGRVCAQFTFHAGKIIGCEELTFFDKANDEDRDLGHTQ